MNFTLYPINTAAASASVTSMPVHEYIGIDGKPSYQCWSCYQATLNATFPAGVIEMSCPPRHAPQPGAKCYCGTPVA